MSGKIKSLAEITCLLFCINFMQCGCTPDNNGTYSEIEKEVKAEILALNPQKNVEISFGLNPDGICAVTVDFTDSRDYDLHFLNNLNEKYKYDITVRGNNLTLPALTTSAIRYLTLINTGDSSIIWPSAALSSELQFLTVQQPKSRGGETRLPQCPGLKSLIISFMDNTCFDLRELKKYPQLEHLIIGQQIIAGKATENEIIFTNADAVKLERLNSLVIVGNCIGYQQFLKASNLSVLGFQQSNIDADAILDSQACISILSLKDCTVQNMEKLDEIKTLKKIKTFQ